jgi:hypothetical protein
MLTRPRVPQAIMMAGGAQLSPQHGAYLAAIGGGGGGGGVAGLGGGHSALSLGPSSMMGLASAQAGGPGQGLDASAYYSNMYQQYSYPQ